MIKNYLIDLFKGFLEPYPLQTQIFISIAIVASPSLPIYFLIKILGLQKKSYFNSLVQIGIAFSIGALAGDLFGHIVPETFHQIKEHDELANYTVIFGICFYYFIDKILSKLTSGHSHSHNHKALEQGSASNVKNIIFLIADGLHNITDGFAIAALYKLNFATGLASTVSILLHEIFHQMGDFSVMLHRKHSLEYILFSQIATGLFALFGGFVGVSLSDEFDVYLNLFVIISFIYVIFTQILPELLEAKSSTLMIGLEMLAIAVGFNLAS